MARSDLLLSIVRAGSQVVELDLPPIRRIVNATEVLFGGAEPTLHAETGVSAP